MTINFTDIAILIIVLFGLYGSLRGGKYVALTMGAVFFAMALVATAGDAFLATANKLGLRLTQRPDRALFLAFLFVATIFLVQNSIGRLIPGLAVTRSKWKELSRETKIWGFLIGLLNGFLVVSIVVHYISPWLDQHLPARSGGWAFDLPTLQFHRPNSNAITLSIEPSTLVVTPSPLIGLYEKVPAALVLLFLLLIFAFIGSLYSRMNRLRS